jgi:hypothetical protein
MRITFAAALVGMIFGWCGCAYCIFYQLTVAMFICLAVTLPCLVFVLLAAFSFHILYFDYSWLGRFNPADPPSSWQPVSSISSGVRIDNHFNGPASFQLGPGGIRVWVPPFPAVFIASTQIVSITSDWWGRGVIEHTSNEIRGPIRVMCSVIAEIDRCMPELSRVRS